MEQATEESIYQLSATTEQDHLQGTPISAPINPSLNIQDPISDLEIGLPGLEISPLVGPKQNTGSLRDVDFTSSRNQSNRIWHLVYIADFNLWAFLVVGVFVLYGYLPKVHPTYLKVMLISIFGVPISVAALSLLIGCWLARDPAGRANLITGLLVANYGILHGVLAGLLALKYGTGN